jgi:hypothetical protein
MPVSNFARTAVNNSLRRTMNGQALNAVGQVGGPLDQLQARMNRSELKYLRTSKMGKYIQGVSINEQGWGVRAKIGKYSFAIGRAWNGLYNDDPEYPEELMARVVIRSLATITTKGAKVVEVVAPMQDPINLRLQNAWEPVAPMGGYMAPGLQAALQSAANVQLVSRLMTRRIWRGAHPMQMRIKMMFEAKVDPVKEVANQCALLMKAASPAQLSLKGVPINCVLIPPGPAPFTSADLNEAAGTAAAMGKAISGMTGGLTENLGNQISTGLANFKSYVGGTALGKGYRRAQEATKEAGTDDIDIYIGNFCTFKRVIIEEVDVEFDMTRIHVSGYPLGATAIVQFSTYEIVTKNTVDSIFSVKDRT